ncbi:MAG: 50S ribosomal protein L3 [Nitrospinota bacterium]
MIGKKVGMTQAYSETGDCVPITVLQMGECRTVQVKTKEKDGYNAIQLAFDEITKKDKKKTAKPTMGHFKKADLKPMKHLKEFRLDDVSDYNPGKKVTVEIFEDGETVSVSGVSKGRGFAGVFKRYGFKGQSATRGSHEMFRHGGSIGNHTEPARVIKGRKMPGHMGNKRVTLTAQKIYKVIKDQNLLLIVGGVPGPNGGLVEITKSKRNKKN